ncbi:MAG: c-type cytochrome [Candidatus Binatia bacterium]
MIDQYASPEELRRLVSTFLVTVGAITIFALFAFIVVPGLRNANKPPAVPAVAAPQGETGWLDPAEYPPERGYELPPVDPKTVLTASPELLKRGKSLFEQNCTACHGPKGQGNGPACTTLNPRPRNFTQSEGWKNGYKLVAIYKTLGAGIKGTGMAAYDYLGARDRMALAHYVQSLGAFPHGSDEPAMLDTLAKQFASAGEKVPNRIPVSRAMAKLEAEFVFPAPLSLPAGGADGGGARLLARIVLDKARVAQTLAQSASWRESVPALAAVVVPGAPANGFAVSVATLSPEEWRVLYEQLLAATHSPIHREGTS